MCVGGCVCVLGWGGCVCVGGGCVCVGGVCVCEGFVFVCVGCVCVCCCFIIYSLTVTVHLLQLYIRITISVRCVSLCPLSLLRQRTVQALDLVQRRD